MKKEWKENYQQIEIPKEYHQKVDDALFYAYNHKRHIIWKTSSKVILLTCCLFMIILNTNSVFASTMSKIPYFGQLCEILTFIDIHEEDRTKIINVNAPALTNTGHSSLENKINHEIQSIIDLEIEKASLRAQDYYQAYLETGGKAEDFMPVNLDIHYEVKYQTNYLVSFLIEKNETLASSYQEYLYYNIDLKKGQILSLMDLVGQDYQTKIAEEIKQQIKHLPQEEQYYYFEDVDIQELIHSQRIFYINYAGELVIKFQKYEIAAGATGPVEFIMPADFIIYQIDK